VIGNVTWPWFEKEYNYMEYISKPDYIDTIIDDIEILKKDYFNYYNCLCADELQPCKIINCVNLVIKKNYPRDKMILFYTDRLIVLKYVNDRISKNTILYSGINYIVYGGVPYLSRLTIYYNYNEKEKISFDSSSNDIVNFLLSDLRKSISQRGEIAEPENVSIIADFAENKQIGALIARKAMINEQSVLACIKQKKVYDRGWSVRRKLLTQAHCSILSNSEVVVLLQNSRSKKEKDINGDLVFIPIQALKSTSIEATGKGMVMKYLFCSDMKYQLFYENERTDELLKIMSFLNGIIQNKQ
jgi:hypothetical protein